MGERLLTETLRSIQGDNLINLAGQPDGIYLYRVITVRMDPSGKNGGLVGEGKVVIQK